MRRYFSLQSLKQKERKEKELKAKLQGEQTALLSRLAELGAEDYVRSLSGEGKTTESPPPPAPSSPSADIRNSLNEVNNMIVDEPDKTGTPLIVLGR